MIRRLLLLLTLAAPTAAHCLPAQDATLVGAIAPILMSEDRRVLDVAVIAPALEYPAVAVRRAAVVAIGRIGDPRGAALLVPRLRDTDQGVIADAFFALGLLKQQSAVAEIVDRLRLPDTLSVEALREAATALARIGGDEAAGVLADVINGSGSLDIDRRDAMRPNAILDAWQLGRRAPVDAILPFTRDTGAGLRYRAVSTLGRVVAPVGGEALLTALRDPNPVVRETAARYLIRRLADTAGLEPASVLPELQRLFDDRSTGVRINALRAAASFRDSTSSPRATSLLRDGDRNVRVAAASALGAMGGATARTALERVLDDDGAEWAVRRAALISLAQLDRAAFTTRVMPWMKSTEVTDRLVAMEAWGNVKGAPAAPFIIGLGDSDQRVHGAALGAWQRAVGRRDAALRAAAESRLHAADPMLRAAAISILADTASDRVLDLLADAWRTGPPRVRDSVLRALLRLGRGDSRFVGRLATPSRRVFLDRPDDPVLRQMAAQGLPQLAARWGGVGPIETGRSLQDYRELTARFYLAQANPRVVVDVQGRGKIELELLAHDAPLTVANFLQLIDRRYFDNVRFHRVVPNFVVQDGDPTGTGEGGPGWSIRDEVNRRRYDSPMLGMALSGPDTGGSQWFINLAPQPHLDGIYTIFGSVVGGQNVLRRIVQGDLIRSIQRGGPG